MCTVFATDAVPAPWCLRMIDRESTFNMCGRRSRYKGEGAVENWKLTNVSNEDGRPGVSGYGVLDALGVRIGHIDGWVTGPEGRVRLLKVRVLDWFRGRGFLVPLGCVTLIDDGRRHVQLTQLTKRTLLKQCLPVSTSLPDPAQLEELIRYFPNPRPAILERFHLDEDLPDHRPGRLTVRRAQGDGSPRSSETPVLIPTPHWIKLGRLAPPMWVRLSNLSKGQSSRE